MLYPNHQPITSANYEAAMAASAGNPIPPSPPTIVRDHRPVVERMADDMLRFGPGMTRKDLKLAGYTEEDLDKYGEEANRRALRRSRDLH